MMRGGSKAMPMAACLPDVMVMTPSATRFGRRHTAGDGQSSPTTQHIPNVVPRFSRPGARASVRMHSGA